MLTYPPYRSAPARRMVALIGSGREPEPSVLERAAQVGAWIAGAGYDLLTGGGEGVMAAASQAFAGVPDRRGLVIGILPGSKVERTDGSYAYDISSRYPNPWVEIAIFTHLPWSGDRGMSNESRNHLNVLSAHVIVALPGGAGTRSEVELAVRYERPVVLYGEAEELHGFHPGPPREAQFAAVTAFVERHLREPV